MRIVQLLAFFSFSSSYKLLCVPQHTILSRSREKLLLQQTLGGNRSARDILVLHNQRLVAKLAYAHKSSRTDIHDLMQEGNLGLLEAISKFDLCRSCRLSTYATFYIRKYIKNYLANMSYTIRLPKYLHHRRRNIHRAQSQLAIRLNRNPSVQEVSDEAGISVLQLQRALSVPFAYSIDQNEPSQVTRHT